MSGFWWLETGETPELTDLGKRISDCIQKHGYTAKDWLRRHVDLGIANGGYGRMEYTLTKVDGKFVMSPPRPAWPSSAPARKEGAV